MKVFPMLNNTVKLGMKYIFAGLSLIIVIGIFHKQLSGLLSLSLTEEARFISIGILFGAIIGGSGVLISAFGFLCQSHTNDQIGLVPTVIILIGLVFIMLVLFFSYSKSDIINKVSPGETITI